MDLLLAGQFPILGIAGCSGWPGRGTTAFTRRWKKRTGGYTWLYAWQNRKPGAHAALPQVKILIFSSSKFKYCVLRVRYRFGAENG